MLKNTMNKIWNSKLMDTFAEVTVGTLETLGEVAMDILNNKKENNNETYEYFKTLDYDEQKFYFENNEYLRDYIKNDYYPNDRELTSRHAQQIADKLNRKFTNMYNQY